MITINVTGSFEGYEEAKQQPGMWFVYIQPCAPQQGLLRMIRVKPEYGKPEDAQQRLGQFGIMCTADKLPTVSFGQKITCAATLWPVLTPMWDARQNAIGYFRRISPRYLLDGEFKSTTAKTAPATASIKGYFAGAVRRETGMVDISLAFDDAAPSGVLRTKSIEKGKGYVVADEMLGQLIVTCDPSTYTPLGSGSAITADGVIWPISTPYWDKEADSIAWPKVAEPHVILSAMREQKHIAEKAAATA